MENQINNIKIIYKNDPILGITFKQIITDIPMNCEIYSERDNGDQIKVMGLKTKTFTEIKNDK